LKSTPPIPRRRARKNPDLIPPPSLRPNVLPPGIPPGVKPPPKTNFRFSSLLPHLGLLMLLVGLWLLIPHGTQTGDEADWQKLEPVIVVDAGHGGHDNGATKNGLLEKQLTLDTALRLEQHLKKRGFTVIMTRKDDRFIELHERAGIANKQRRALFVSIHFNDSSTGSGDGVETFYASEKVAPSSAGFFSKPVEPPPADNGAGFAQLVQQSIIGRLDVKDRGIKERAFAVVRHTRCPAILVEGGFVNNAAEARKLANPRYRDQLAAAICEGVVAYHNQRTQEAAKTQVAAAR
jgi:N-acetylmuramoyl-L-alanine amidase